MSVAPVPAPNGAPAPSAITDVSYRNYDGELNTRALRWWTIAVATIRANVNRKKYGFWIPVALTFLIYFFIGIEFYFTQGLREQMAGMGNIMGMDAPANPYAMTLYQGMVATPLMVVVAAMTVGSAVIAADNRANALLVYLSKPITRTDYLVGKWVGVFLLLAGLTLGPALLMYLFFVVTYNEDGFLKQNPTLILRLLAATLLAAAVHTSLILGFSAWSKTPRLAGALYAAFYFVTLTLSATMGSVLLEKDKNSKQPQTTALVANLSVNGAVAGMTMHLYQVTPQQWVNRNQNGGRRRGRRSNRPNAEQSASSENASEKTSSQNAPGRRQRRPPLLPERPPLPAMLLLSGTLIALPLAAAYAKVRAVEVIRG